MAALVRAFVPACSDAEHELLERTTDVTLTNWNGIKVGRLAAHHSLQKRRGA
jgi:hypothetical protein